MPKTKTPTAEDQVRSYMLYLSDPTQLIDDAEVEKATQALATAINPIDRLKAHAELTKMTTIDPGPLREGFIAVAKTWAENVGVGVTQFMEMKVPDEVLSEAGFNVAESRRAGRVPGKNRTGAPRKRAAAVPVEEIKSWVLRRTGTFTQVDIIAGIGGSHATVGKALNELVDAGQVNKLGPMPDYKGRGRAPNLYEVVKAEAPASE